MDRQLYLHNLNLLKGVLDKYTIADLKTMIEKIKPAPSGACCYPAMQTLVSLMELMGKLLKGAENEDAFVYVFQKIGNNYNHEEIGKNIYQYFRHGIAHNSIAKKGVLLKKDDDSVFHLSNGGMNIDLKVFFKDFLPVYEKIFAEDLKNENFVTFYEKNLKSLLSELEIKWNDFLVDPVMTTSIQGASGMTQSQTTTG